MTLFDRASFTATDGTLVDAYTGEDGQTYLRAPAMSTGSVVPVITGGVLTAGSDTAGNEALYRSQIAAPVTDYEVTLDYTYQGAATDLSGPYVRLTASTGSLSSIGGYGLVYAAHTSQVRLIKEIPNTGRGTIANTDATGINFTNGVTYRMTIRVTGTGATVSLSGRVQRLSDNQWLRNDCTWQSAQVDCVTYADTATDRMVAAGYTGFCLYQITNPGTIDNVFASDLASGVLLSNLERRDGRGSFRGQY